jgi:hypothetical protein
MSQAPSFATSSSSNLEPYMSRAASLVVVIVAVEVVMVMFGSVEMVVLVRVTMVVA